MSSKISLIKSILSISGIIFMVAIVINFYIILLFAVFYNGSVNVHFNHFNEAYIEYIVYVLILPIIVYSCYTHVQAFRSNRRRRKVGKISTINPEDCIGSNERS